MGRLIEDYNSDSLVKNVFERKGYYGKTHFYGEGFACREQPT